MYAKRIQLHNYGPIDRLDITFPFAGDVPKPVVLVGENGSGKSMLLSHIVNGLISAKDIVYSETPEVEIERVYKLRSNRYIKLGKEYYFGKVEFDKKLLIQEMRSQTKKQKYTEIPNGISKTDAQITWNMMEQTKFDLYDSNFYKNEDKIRDLITKNCILYFPFNRFEEPVWLNKYNLKAKPQYTDSKRVRGYTNRKIINYSPLQDNQNWLFDIIYDVGFLLQFVGKKRDTTVLHEYVINVYHIALKIIQKIIREERPIIFKLGTRHERMLSIESESGELVPNIFHFSSGETSLMNLFLSILRDFDLSGTPFSSASDIQGIVVVDEIDLHLHAIHQSVILPELIKMFPRIQFIITTHSPLFVLGMNKFFGEDGFYLYQLPKGQQINPEEFNEFENAYLSFTETIKFSEHIRKEIANTQKTILVVEGKTDEKYICKAVELLGHENIIDKIKIIDGKGSPNLSKIWNNAKSLLLSDIISQKMILLFDCDVEKQNCDNNRGNIFKRIIPTQETNPIKKGIENLFEASIMNEARECKSAFIDITDEHKYTTSGKEKIIPERWAVNKDQKTNLCNWLCDNGTKEDFRHFEVIFELLEGLLD